MSRSGDSVRPSRSDNSVEVGGGLGDRAGRHERDVGVRNLGSCTTVDDAVPCCPVAQDDAPDADAMVAPNVDESPNVDELIASEEQESAEMPLVLLHVYQPT